MYAGRCAIMHRILPCSYNIKFINLSFFALYLNSLFIAVIETKPFHKFSIPIKSEGFDEGEGLACQLVFTYTAKYPDELPIIEIEDDENFDDIVDKDELLSHLTEQVMQLIVYFIPSIIQCFPLERLPDDMGFQIYTYCYWLTSSS